MDGWIFSLRTKHQRDQLILSMLSIMRCFYYKFWLDLVYRIRIRGSSPYSFISFNFFIYFTRLELHDEFVKRLERFMGRLKRLLKGWKVPTKIWLCMVKNIKSNFTSEIIGRFILLLSICTTCSNSVHAPKNESYLYFTYWELLVY